MGGWNEGETWVIFFWFLIFFDTQKKISTIQGSKTTQAIEALYARAAAKEGGVPTGFVVANELDAERSYVLAKRCGALRAAAASCVVTCHRAQIFPAPLHHCAGVFDRIVCDVPCSGHSPLLQIACSWRQRNIKKLNFSYLSTLEHHARTRLLWCHAPEK